MPPARAIGVATANLYPHLTLSASVTEAAAGPGSLFEAGSTLWSIGAGLAGPIFHGGSLEAERRAAIDGYKVALADYRQTIVTSLGQVGRRTPGDQPRRRRLCSAGPRARRRADESALEPGRLPNGETGVLQVLDAEGPISGPCSAISGRKRLDISIRRSSAWPSAAIRPAPWRKERRTAMTEGTRTCSRHSRP